MRGNTLMSRAAWIVAGAAALSAAPVLSQAVVAGPDEEITVTSRYGTTNVQSLSQAVSYRDLDLSTEAGRKILRHRVALTARYLCGKLGESDTSPGVVPSCRQAAVTDAMKRVGTIEEGFAPRGTAWVVPPAWAPPYPADWDTRYPG